MALTNPDPASPSEQIADRARPVLVPAFERLPVSYVLPLATMAGEDVSELGAYLAELGRFVDDVIVVDGSSPSTVEDHRAAFGHPVRVLTPTVRTPMGKVGNVLTGIRAARHEHVVIADDDVRYEPEQLRRLDRLLLDAAVVRPQNHFDPLPWHARIDTARTLLARVSGGDWPGTLAVRRSAVLQAGGYRGDVLFENLELVRTLRAHGGTEHVALDVVVRRVPPTTRHFRRQQVRQAYDELARPCRLVLSLAVVPWLVRHVRRRSARPLVATYAVTVALAEAGRRRGGGAAYFPASSTLLTGPWLVWRSICSWIALGSRIRGGAKYRAVRLRAAATPTRMLRRRGAALTAYPNGYTCPAEPWLPGP